jgi:hypothetical protein
MTEFIALPHGKGPIEAVRAGSRRPVASPGIQQGGQGTRREWSVKAVRIRRNRFMKPDI